MDTKRLAATFLLSAALIATSQPGVAAQAADAADSEDAGRPIRTDEIEERADTSFSAYPLGEEALGLQKQGFTLVDADCAKSGDGCVWRDPDGVLHYLDADNMLMSKAVVAEDFAGRPIAALGIGTARDRATVLKNASRHLLGANPGCLEAGAAGEGDGIASCTYEFSKIRVKLLFGSANQLLRADLYQVGGI